MNDERKSSPATRPLDCGKICGLTQRCRTDAALAVLVAIMEDETAALCSRIAAANSVLAWANVEWVAMDPAVGGRGEQRQSPVEIAWFRPPQALASAAKSRTKDLS